VLQNTERIGPTDVLDDIDLGGNSLRCDIQRLRPERRSQDSFSVGDDALRQGHLSTPPKEAAPSDTGNRAEVHRW